VILECCGITQEINRVEALIWHQLKLGVKFISLEQFSFTLLILYHTHTLRLQLNLRDALFIKFINKLYIRRN